MRIMAHLRDIVYVDYRLVDPEKVEQAREQYQDELYELNEEEAKKEEDEQKAAGQAVWLRRLRDVNLEGVDTLLSDMLNEEADAEQKKLANLSFWVELIDEIQTEFKCFARPLLSSVAILRNVRRIS